MCPKKPRPLQLRGLLQDGQLAEARRLAHSLKGVSATLDVQELTKAAASVELALANGQANNLDDLLQSLEATLTLAVEAALTLAEHGEARATAPADAAEASTHRPLSPESLITLNAFRKLL
ncbi:Hpt domain-containing protein [Desulfonatronum sp. SC1]|uniref:Hpt domain-containing protein n=1 Tax=Desulfonatronum sp. SC1 TaxID=2109626 RepID=UPI002101AAF2|nr:Hpt domain-containing protein [Desulfonatronum sp. SC1]